MSRFLNVVYHVAAQRLKEDEKQPERPRHEFDHSLSVHSWDVPGGVRQRAPRPEGAPSWWTDDEDASQQFLTSMGVVMDG